MPGKGGIPMNLQTILRKIRRADQDYHLIGSLTVIKSKNIGKPLKYGFFFVKFLFLYVVCVVIMI